MCMLCGGGILLTSACPCQGIAHQDLKPDNVFVDGVAADGTPHVILGDLGSSISEGNLRVAFTRNFVTPEVLTVLRRLKFDMANFAEHDGNAQIAEALVTTKVRCTPWAGGTYNRG
jgi:serine/threonine protein kinase